MMLCTLPEEPRTSPTRSGSSPSPGSYPSSSMPRAATAMPVTRSMERVPFLPSTARTSKSGISPAVVNGPGHARGFSGASAVRPDRSPAPNASRPSP